MSDTTDNIFFSGEKMEETEKEEITFWQTVKKDFIQNAAKYVTNAIIFAIFFIGSAFLLGFKFTSEKLSGALTEPVANQVVNKISPELQEMKSGIEQNGEGIQALTEYNEKKEKQNIIENAKSYISDIKKYYSRINEGDTGWTPEHLEKLTDRWGEIPDEMKTDDVIYKYQFDIDFLRKQGF